MRVDAYGQARGVVAGAAAGLMGSPGGLTASGSSYFGAAGFSTPPAPGDRFGSAIGCGTYGSGESSRLIAIGAPRRAEAVVASVRDIQRRPGTHGMGRAIFAIVVGALVSLVVAAVLIT